MALPPNPSVNQILRFTLAMFHGGQLFENKLDYVITGVVGGGINTPDLAQLMLAKMQATHPALMSSSVTISGVSCQAISMASTKVVQSGVARDQVTVGLLAANLAPTQCAFVVGKGTGFAGQIARGRLYWGPLPQAVLTGAGEIDSTYSANVTSMFAGNYLGFTLTSGATSDTLKCVLLHKVTKLVPFITTDLDNFIDTGRIGNQRRRGDYGRRNSNI